jgi:hypothetical protein
MTPEDPMPDSPLREARTAIYGLISDRVASGASGDWMSFEAAVNDVFDAALAAQPSPSLDRLHAIETAARAYVAADAAYGQAAASVPMVDGEWPEHGTAEWAPVRQASRARTSAWNALLAALDEPTP